MTRGRKIAWALACTGAAVFAATIGPMVVRIREYNEHAHFLHLHFEPQFERSFKLPGFPQVTLTDTVNKDGTSCVRLDYGQPGTPSFTSMLIPVAAPTVKNLPTLEGYDEWLKVAAFNQVERDPTGEQRATPGTERLMIAVRHTPAGFDPATWGSVRKTEWIFDFYDLKPDGHVTLQTQRWPRTYEGELSLREQAKTDPRMKALEAIPPLEQRTPEYQMALYVLPKLNVPDYKFSDTAFNFDVLGWTLPATMGSILLFVGGLMFAIAPKRVGTP